MKTKNNIHFLVFLFLLFLACSPKHATNNKYNQLHIQLVDFSTITAISVDCSNFESYFPDRNISLIIDSAMINKTLKQLSSLEPIDSNYSKYVDVRAKLLFTSDFDTLEVCIGDLSLAIGDSLFKTPDSLKTFLSKLD